MAPANGKASDVVRRSSTRRSLALSVGSAREDEDYDLSAIVVADGFRPVESSSSHTSNSQPATDTFTRTTTNTDTNTESDTSTIPQLPPSLAEIPSKHNPGLADRPSSISKPHRAHDSLTLRNDGSSHAAPAQPNAGATSSRANASPLMRVESPYRGPSNPSHPYQMYPQRTLSNATSSTTDPSHSGRQGPAHPYSLYPQNTVPVEESSEPHIPVGFNSIGNTYQRQLGPDGEEAGDLIGPMGHLEELPPYTRYPTEGPVRKESPDANAAQNPAGTSTQAIAGAGGIGMATRNPEFSSTDEDLALSRSRPSVRSATSELSQHDINTAAREVTEKPAMGKWQRRAKKKMWGIVPYWAICLLVVGLVIMGVVMGSVIGTLLSRHKPPRHQGSDSPDSDDSSTTYDIQPIDTLPSELPPLATGIFGLPPLDVSEAPDSCVKQAAQTEAWSCDIPFRYYKMDVEYIPHTKNTSNYELTVTPINGGDAKFIWGTQPPNVPDPLRLTLVNDTFQRGYGPAWWLNVTYDKTVIVHEEDFAAPTRKRGYTYHDPSLAEFDPGQFRKKSPGAEPGDRPWICTWPETTLEIFLYPSENVTLPFTTSTTASVPSATSTADSEESSSADLVVWPTMTPCPNVVKFLERRLSVGSDSEATCQQVIISENGQDVTNVTDEDGDPVVVVVEENPNSLYEKRDQIPRYARSWPPQALQARDAVELTDCGCRWMST